MPFTEEELVPISALQHFLFCERQCALIHLEQIWVENRLTTEGNQLHEKAHTGPSETRNQSRTTRGIPICSYELGIIGHTDVVTWTPDSIDQNQTLAEQIESATEKELQAWSIVPVEYKRGKPKKDNSDNVQLCAQALCLEEMLNVEIPVGEFFYGQPRRRVSVELDDSLRAITKQTILKTRELFASLQTPPAIWEPKCRNCSLVSECLPKVTSHQGAGKLQNKTARQYLHQQLQAHVGENQKSKEKTEPREETS